MNNPSSLFRDHQFPVGMVCDFNTLRGFIFPVE
jgi:hypothetical protein